MADRVTPFGVGFLVDEHAALADDSIHADVTSAIDRARTLADANPGRRFDVYFAVEIVRVAPSAPAQPFEQPKVTGLERVSLGTFNLAVVDLDGDDRGIRDVKALYASLDDALKGAHLRAAIHPGRRFGVFVRGQSQRTEPSSSSSTDIPEVAK
ncbi:hypothetical protein MFUR16E_04410 [Methylobacterium fujisawaense]|uniref:hypothetical protein n=1 Tax=Methylobacterium fujisawaense TaxID=107400 RepID=UPI002F2BE567